MSYFFALPLDRLAQQIERDLLIPLSIVDKQQQVRWSSPENLHITLAYLGDIDSQRAIDAARQLPQLSSFDLPIGTLSYFPDAKSRILALDIVLNNELSKLRTDLCQQLQAHKVEYDQRNYRPHITLGRIKHREQIDHWQLPQYSVSLLINEFVLYFSDSAIRTKSSTSAYQVIERFKLS